MTQPDSWGGYTPPEPWEQAEERREEFGRMAAVVYGLATCLAWVVACIALVGLAAFPHLFR